METTANRVLDQKDHIYPWIKTTVYPTTKEEIEFDAEDTAVNKDWLGGLKIFYVIDQDKNVSFILKKEIPEGYNIDDIHKIAIQNLENNIEYRFNKLNIEGGYGLLAGGDYEVSSITIPSIWDWIVDELKDDVIVGIPAKDLVFITPFSDTDGIINITKAVNEIFEDGEHLLSKSLFRYSKSNKWSLYRP